MATVRPKKASGSRRQIDAESLAVWLDDASFGPLLRIGTLSRTSLESVRFSYDKTWLQDPKAFNLDPRLSLDRGDFYPKESNFGVFLDSCPDRWGEVLMRRRELVEARDQGRARRELYAWDFLLGVQDITRMGALRFSRASDVGSPTFLASEALAAPPVTQIAELQKVALELSRTQQDDLPMLRQWLKVLVAPGSSLGGARPKANIRGEQGGLWIAKFPSADDDTDVALREMLAHDLAEKCDIDVPPARLERIGSSRYHTFRVQRFDRSGDKRRFFTSAMTLLERTSKDEASYLDLAEIIATKGSPRYIEHDLRELFRRVTFNVTVANRDDHLRNHGFLMTPEGFRLSPAYDVNPATRKDAHVLALNEVDTSPNLENVLETAEYYRLTEDQARTIIDSVIDTVRNWEQTARHLGLSAEDRADLEAAFTLKWP